MENKYKVSFLIGVASLLQTQVMAQSIAKFLNTSGLYTSNLQLQALEKGDTLKFKRITERKAMAGDFLFEKGTVRQYMVNGIATTQLGTWSVQKGFLILRLHKNLYIKPLTDTSGIIQ